MSRGIVTARARAGRPADARGDARPVLPLGWVRRESADGRRSPVRRLIVWVGVLLVALAGTGCSIQVRVATTVHDDGRADVALRMAADKQIQQLLAQQTGQPAAQVFDDLVAGAPAGWKTQQGTDPDGTRWVTIGRSFPDLAALDRAAQDPAGPVSTLGLRDVSLTQTDGLFRRTTTFKAVADPAEALSRSSLGAQAGQAAGMLDSVLSVENRVTLPGRIGQTNADERDGGTAVWRLRPSVSTSMQAESVAYQWAKIAVLLVAAGIALLGVVLGVLVLRGGRRR